MRNEYSARWARLPLLLVLLALVAAIVLPVVIGNRTTSLWTEVVEVTDPARGLVTEIEFAVAAEAAATRGYLLTEDETYIQSQAVARADRDSAYAELRTLAEHIGPTVAPRVDTLGRLIARSDTQRARIFAGPGPTAAGAPEAVTDTQQVLFSEILALSEELLRDIDEREAGQITDIRSTGRTSTWITILLVFLALVSTLVVAWLSRRYRLLTVRLESLLEDERTAREEAEQARSEAVEGREELERVTESRTRLIRGFSHDVKNPLNAADGHLQLVEDGILGELDSRQSESIGKARVAIGSAVGLIEDLLDLARAEAGLVDTRREPTDLRGVATKLADEYALQARNQGLAFELEVEDDPPRIDSDGRRIAQIVGNLLSNAVKYTDEGSITLRLRLRRSPGDSDRRCAVFEVEDTGPGISEEQQRLLFQEFSRLDTGGTERGAGIGLSISRRLAHALGGEITLESEPGRGSTFALWLPTE